MKKVVLFLSMLILITGLVACDSVTPTPQDQSYTVTFDVQGGSAVKSLEVTEGTQITLSNYTTAKNEFNFEGWSLTLNGTVLTGTYTVNSNTTLYAKFVSEERTYQISFYDNDGSFLISKVVSEDSIPSHTYIVIDNDEWDYSFEGWKTSLESSTVLDVLPAANANASYYASVTAVKKQYTITYITNGGSTVGSTTVDYGTEVQEPSSPTKEGFTFVAWTSDIELQNAKTWPIVVTENISLYASWNETIEIGTYLEILLSTYAYDVMDYIPEKLQAGGVLVDQSQTTVDYSSFVNLSSISSGYGEQWQMVLDNLSQTQSFTEVLNVVDSLSITAVTLFNNYLDSNPEDVNSFTFTSGIYNVTINYEDDIIYLVIDFTAEFPVFNSQTAQIMLSYNVLNQEKEGRIQIGDANALKYVITEDSYTFAIKYLGIRSAYFNIYEHIDGSIKGTIYEFLGLDNSVSTSSAAQFEITDNYVSVVGNKASGIIGFTSIINELYNPSTGKLLGYEIKENIKSITYNTLWFNLSDQTGITSIMKVDEANGSNLDSIYVNGSASLFTSKNVGGINIKSLSRRYDIEFRKQYVYYMDGTTLTSVEVEVPMLFVQAEQYNSLVTDVRANNSNLSSFNITVSATTLAKIEVDYETTINVFVIAKDNTKNEDVIEYIGSKIAH